MTKNMKISEHIYNYSVFSGKHDNNLFKTEAQTTHRRIAESGFCYAARIACQKIQKMRQIKLPLRRRTRTRGICPFCQYAWQKPCYGLCLPQKQGNGDASFSQLSKCSKDYGRNQRHQSRNVSPKGTFVTEKSWRLRQKYPP